MTESGTPRESARGRTFMSGLAMAGGIATKIVANLVLVRLAFRSLSVQDYGLWVVAQSLVAYLGLSEIGLGQTVMNYQGAALARGDTVRINRILGTAFCLYWGLITVFAVVGVGIVMAFPVHSWVLRDATPELVGRFSPLLVGFGILTLLAIPWTVVSATISGLRQHHIRLLFEMLVPLVSLGGAALALKAHGGLPWLVAVPGVIQILYGFCAYVLLRRLYPAARLSMRAFSRPLARELLANSVFFFLFSLSTLVHRSAGNILGSRFAGPALLPQIHTALLLLRIMGWSILDILPRAIQPYVILYDATRQEGRINLFGSLCAKLSQIGCLMYCAAVWLLGEMAIRLWLGPTVFIGYRALAPLLGSFFLDASLQPAVQLLVGRNRHRALSFAAAFHALSSLGLGYAGARWLPEEPLLGIGLGFFASSLVVQLAVMPWVAARGAGLSVSAFCSKYLWAPAILLGIALLPLAIVYRMQVGTASGRVLALVASIGMLLGTAWHLVFEPEERDVLRSLVPRRLRLGAKVVAPLPEGRD